MDARHFAELAVALHDEPTVEETLDEVLRFAVDGVGCAMAGVVFVHGRGLIETAAATDDECRFAGQWFVLLSHVLNSLAEVARRRIYNAPVARWPAM